jgi:hypothetical protein
LEETFGVVKIEKPQRQSKEESSTKRQNCRKDEETEDKRCQSFRRRFIFSKTRLQFFFSSINLDEFLFADFRKNFNKKIDKIFFFTKTNFCGIFFCGFHKNFNKKIDKIFIFVEFPKNSTKVFGLGINLTDERV